MQLSIIEILENLSELVAGMGLHDHAVDIKMAASQDGAPLTIPGYGVAPAKVVLWLLSVETAQTFAELQTACEAVMFALRTFESSLAYTAASTVRDTVRELNITACNAKDVLRRAVAA